MSDKIAGRAEKLLVECRPIFVGDCTNSAYSMRGKARAAMSLANLDAAISSGAECANAEDVFLDACVLTSFSGRSAKMRGLAARVRNFSEEHFPSAFRPAGSRRL